MKIFFTCFFIFLTVSWCNSQSKVDSLVDRLNGKNIPVLSEQLYAVVDHRVLESIDSNRAKWPEILNSISSKVLNKASSFDAESKTITLAHMAEVLVRDNRSGLGYKYIQQALEQCRELKG